jgi:hypothetical protein
MKMKFEQIIESFNDILKSYRAFNNLDNDSFFTSRRSVKRLMGSVKEFELVIEFYNVKTKTPYKILDITHRVNATKDLEESIWEELERSMIARMLIMMKYGKGVVAWDKFVDGSYAGIE